MKAQLNILGFHDRKRNEAKASKSDCKEHSGKKKRTAAQKNAVETQIDGIKKSHYVWASTAFLFLLF